MGLLTPATPRIDTSSARWMVAVHETAHVVVARHFGWRVTAVVIDGHGNGSVDGRPPWLHGRARTGDQAAVIALAGHAANARLRWTPRGPDIDERLARDALRRSGLSYELADQAARDLVDRHWHRITDHARHLYRTGATR